MQGKIGVRLWWYETIGNLKTWILYCLGAEGMPHVFVKERVRKELTLEK